VCSSRNCRRDIASWLRACCPTKYVAGMHDALVALHEAEMSPFDKGYEGDPYHDFKGRLDDWDWPEGEARF
jgi:hypothetical protein